MVVTTVDGEEIKWSYKDGRRENCSKLHEDIRALLKSLYPTLPILEEVSIPVFKNKVLFLDFFIPINKLAIEADGGQHDKYTPHFHQNYKNYIFARKNDSLKDEFCQINNIKLIRLKHNEQRIWKELFVS